MVARIEESRSCADASAPSMQKGSAVSDAVAHHLAATAFGDFIDRTGALTFCLEQCQQTLVVRNSVVMASSSNLEETAGAGERATQYYQNQMQGKIDQIKNIPGDADHAQALQKAQAELQVLSQQSESENTTIQNTVNQQKNSIQEEQAAQEMAASYAKDVMDCVQFFVNATSQSL